MVVIRCGRRGGKNHGFLISPSSRKAGTPHPTPDPATEGSHDRNRNRLLLLLLLLLPPGPLRLADVSRTLLYPPKIV